MVNEQPTNTSAKIIDCEPVEWAGAKGGTKYNLLNAHADEIMAFLNENGTSATLMRYGMLPNTLDRLVERSGDLPARQHIRDLKRVSVLVQLSMEHSRSALRKAESLESSFTNFKRDLSDLVATKVGNAIISSLRQSLDKALDAGDDKGDGDDF